MQSETEILILVILAVSAMIIMALSIVMVVVIYHKKGISNKLEIAILKTKQQKDLMERNSSAQEEERRRISANLHDEVGSSLSAIYLMVGQIRMNSEGENRELATDAEKHLDTTMEEIRNIIQNISPAIVEKFGLYEAVREICIKISAASKININFNIIDQPTIENKILELKLYRIAQELLNNIIKHANASNIEVVFQNSNETFTLSILDDGIGISPEKIEKSKSLGIENIRNQVELLQGRFRLESRTEKGTIASVSIPAKKLLLLHKK